MNEKFYYRLVYRSHIIEIVLHGGKWGKIMERINIELPLKSVEINCELWLYISQVNQWVIHAVDAVITM